MSTGLRAPNARAGLARPAAAVKRTGLAKPANLIKTPSTGKVATKSASREVVGATPAARGAAKGLLKPSASNHSIGGLSRSGSQASVQGGMSPLRLGMKVMMKDTNLEGTVRYYGEPQFAKGTWVGVELDTEQGKNEGVVKGVRYFTCQPNFGLFCKPDKLKLLKEPEAMRPMRTPSQVNVSKVDYEAKFGLHVGSRVLVNGAKNGTLLFLGLTSFAKGVWAGVALDTDDGKNDGSVKGERYFTCDPDHGLFAQASKIKMLESPFTSSSSLSSFETPRKNNEEPDVMKPDFVNRTPASTPGVTSSLSGILRSKSRDIESMQKNIGDLQQRLNEVNKTPTRNGPSIQNSQQHKVGMNESSDQYEQLKKIHENSEKERSELVEKMKGLENEKLTYEARIAEVAEAADNDKSSLNHKIDQLNKEMVVVTSNNSSQLNKLQDDLARAEAELLTAQDKVTDYESCALQNDNSAELTMNREKITELQAELKSLRSCQDADKTKINDLQSRLSESHQRTEAAQNQFNSKLTLLQSDAAELEDARSRVSELERLLSEAQESLQNREGSLHSLQESSDNKNSELSAQRETSAQLGEDLESTKQQVSELQAEIITMRSAHESAIQVNDNKHSTLAEQLVQRDATIGELKAELSGLSSTSSSEKLHLEKRLEDSASDVARLQDQSTRDSARIVDLESLVSSASSDSDSQLVAAHKKLSELEKRLKEREAESTEEMKAVKETITDLQDELGREKQHASEQMEEADKKCKDLQVSLDQVQMERSMEQIQTEKEIGELQLQLADSDKLNSQNSGLKNKINDLQTQLSSLQSKSSDLEDSNKSVSRLQAQLESDASEHGNLVASLENNIDELETRLATVNNDKAAEAELSVKREAELVRANQTKIRELEQSLEQRAGQLSALEAESAAKISGLEVQLGELQHSVQGKTALEEELTTTRAQLDAAELQLRDLAEEYDAKLALASEEKTRLTRDLGSVTKELGELKIKTNRQSDEEIENLHKQIHNLNEENDMLKLAFNDKSAEFEELTTEVSTLREISETAFSELKKNEEQFTSSVRKLKTTEIQLDEALEKMRELQTKINDLEEEVVRERSRAHELEQRIHSPPEMSFEYVDNLSNISASPPVNAPSFIPNRLFCDNCDVFDDHDTDDCRIGASPIGGSKHGGHRGLSGRPYCTVCEMFGHTAEECEDDMTF